MTTKRELEDKLIIHAWQDEAFKQQLLSQPKEALAKEGINLPSNVEVSVLEEKPNHVYLVLPINPASELSDAELESVAGGGGAKKDWGVSVNF